MAKEMEQGEVEALINELEAKMNRLRAVYEQYFMGIERKPPHNLRKEVVRLVYELENSYIRNTAVKFKMRSMIQRFSSYKAYWRRVERQIEEGTYVRDIRRAERNRERRRERSDNARGDRDGGNRDGADDDGIVELDMDDIVDLGDLQVELEQMEAEGAFDRPAQSQSQSQSRPESAEERERIKKQRLAEIAGQLGIDSPPKPQKPAGGGEKPAPRSKPAPGSVANRREKLSDIKKRLEERTGKKVGAGSAERRPKSNAGRSAGGGKSDDEARRVYDQLLEAKRRCNEPTSGISYDKLASSMKKQREQLQKKRGARDVEFKVVIKDGRAFLKPETK